MREPSIRTGKPARSKHELGRSFQRLVAISLAASIGLAAAVANANGIDPTKISLPKGPGSIEGLASADFSPSLSSGSASYEVPIAVPPASAGFGPHLSLAYDSSGGATEIGIGWRIAGMPKIRRRLENGLPRFDDTDAFELVGIGIPSDLVEVSPGVFRPSVEDGSFVRVERSSDGTEWEARTKAGLTLRFGGAGFTESEGEHVAAYLLREAIDRHGHVVAYEWDATEGHALPSRVVWNSFGEDSENEVRFDYEARPDRHRLFSSGIREVVTRRLHAVAVFHGGELVRRYELTYDEGIHSVLRSVDMVGRDGTSRLPSARFDYTEATLAASPDLVVTMDDAPGQSPKDPDAALADLDGDGLPDLLIGRAGRFRAYLNHDGKRWLPPVDWGDRSPTVSLSTKGVELADLDADGAPDLVVKSGLDSFRYFPRPTATGFDAPVSVATVPSFSFEDADVRIADMDGDRRADVVVTTEAGLAVGYNRGGTDWTEPAVVGVVDARQKVLFSDGRTSLCDVNGDRVLDLCTLHSGGMSFWLGRGRGAFEPGEEATGVPDFDASAPYRLVDVNGDGWVDLVRVGATTIDVAVAVGEGRFGAVHTIDGTPGRGPATDIELSDMNASGTTDIVWVDVSGNGSASWRYLELFPNGRAGLLRRIDNGLGKVQTISYSPAAAHAARARDAGTPWSTRINVPMPVVDEIEVDLSLGDPVLVTKVAYRDGTYDPQERTFAGFGGATQYQLGDAATPTLITDETFDTGLTRRELRGSPLTESTGDESGTLFSRTTRTYTSRTLATSADGRPISYSFASSELVEHLEKGAAAARSTLTEYQQDEYGDVTEERRWGEVAGSDRLVGHDEAIVTRTFANDPGEWLLGYVATEALSDGRGKRVSFTRKYYDGVPFQGLPLGRVTRGDVSREEAWTGPEDDAFELVIATKYDDDGLPVETRDGVGGGRFFEWASDHTSIASERVKLESSAVLVERAVVDGAFGALLAATDYAGRTTSYAYDPFGRLTRVVKPGDTGAQPTVRYDYDVTAPLSRVVTELRVVSGEDAVDRSETLVDGAGRERGTLTRDGDRWIFAGVSLYDARANARRSLSPRAVGQSDHDAPPLLDGTPRGSDTYRDARGRPIRTRSEGGTETRTEYAPLEVRRWDGGQNDPASPYEHTPAVERTDGLGRVVAHARTLDGRTLVATYAYDAGGALVSRTDPEGHAARYDYDGRGRRVAVHDPDLGDTRFSFDAAGNLVARTYADGVTARFTFDLAGRSLTEDWNSDGSPEIQRFWDASPTGDSDRSYLGKLARVVEPTGSVEHAYDERGRAVSTRYDIDGSVYEVRSDYDGEDRERLHTYPDGSSIEIRRNARGQVAGYGAAVDFSYGDDGLETERRFNTGVRVGSGYDDERRRNELTVTAPGGPEVHHIRFTYDSGGNLTRQTDLRGGIDQERDRTETHTYDNLYRLTGVEGPWGAASYRYSDSGNLIGRTSTVASQSISEVRYGDRPHLPSAFDGRHVTSDARGRMTNDGVRAYDWNEIDELVAVSSSSGSVESRYGDDGVRRSRVEHRPDGTSTTTHFIDAWTESEDGKLVRYIVHGGQRIVRLADDNGVVGASAERSRRVSAGSSSERLPNAPGLRPRDRDAREATAPPLGLLCLVAFALTAATRIIVRARRAWSFRSVSAVVRVALAGVGLALVATSPAPATLAVALAVLAALISARNARIAKTARCVVAAVGVALTLGACGSGDDVPSTNTAPPRGSIRQLSGADTLIVTDLLGSLVGETTGTGTPKTEFAAYPFGATRYDTSHATWKFAGTPRDGAVDLDCMGARFYAPELGVWTSGDPVAINDPERLVTPEFAAANPYAYANLRPVTATDRDGHFWQVLAAGGFGAIVGGAIEAARQYLAHGRVDDLGRVGAAAASGAVQGMIVAANPAAGITSAMGIGGVANTASGLTERLIASGGKDAGTLKEASADFSIGAATGGALRGASALLERLGRSARALATYRDAVERLDVSTPRDGAVVWSAKGNREIAEEFATSTGRSTLEMTPGGKWLDQRKLFDKGSPLSRREAASIWGRLSERFVQGASGDIVGFVRGSRSTSVFQSTELPGLVENRNVTNIITMGF